MKLMVQLFGLSLMTIFYFYYEEVAQNTFRLLRFFSWHLNVYQLMTPRQTLFQALISSSLVSGATKHRKSSASLLMVFDFYYFNYSTNKEEAFSVAVF